MLETRAFQPSDEAFVRAAGLEPNDVILMLEKDGVVIGAAGLEGTFLRGIYIAPEWRRRGYGTFLLRRLCRNAPKELRVHSAEQAAAFFYACGFRRQGSMLCRGVREARDNAVATAHAYLHAHILPGTFAVDATAGNGYDTEFLCREVGAEGKVLALDIQQKAVDATNERLRQQGLSHIGHARLADHADLSSILKHEGMPFAVMFNLGYLPGGDHAVFTTPKHSLPALQAGLSALVPGGVMTICAYSGGLQGTAERDAVLQWANGLDKKAYEVVIHRFEGQTGFPPVTVCITKYRLF